MTNTVKNELVGLNGGKDATYWEIINVTESTIKSYPSIDENGQKIDYPLCGTDEQMIKYWENKKEVSYYGLILTIAGNAVVAESELRNRGYDAMATQPNKIEIKIIVNPIKK